ncbi:MAG TPA: HAD-IA family hydrolase [Solirubrobacteraceae bacterium]|nr:HAD-IA family hydrolase [Solirubrobacteraceae bacterium]
MPRARPVVICGGRRAATAGRSRRGWASRALLIDALGTLVALRPPAPALVRELGERFGCEISEQQASAALAAEIRFYRSHMQMGRDDAGLRELRRRCAAAMRDALPGEVRAGLGDLGELADALMASLSFEAFEDARPALVGAREAGLAAVAVSNWDVSLEGVLEHAGLAPLLDAVVTSAAVGAAKPDGAIFRFALELAGAQPRRAVHIGDSLREDVEGALRCGIRAVLLNRAGAREGVAPPPALTISTLTELAPLLDRLWT